MRVMSVGIAVYRCEVISVMNVVQKVACHFMHDKVCHIITRRICTCYCHLLSVQVLINSRYYKKSAVSGDQESEKMATGPAWLSARVGPHILSPNGSSGFKTECHNEKSSESWPCAGKKHDYVSCCHVMASIILKAVKINHSYILLAQDYMGFR